MRIGQNTVFTFDSEYAHAFDLEKGSLLFHIPKGNGGGTIKTPSLTAAITGTTGKVSPNIIAIIEGVVKLVPSGRLVRTGEFARRNADGTITIGFFDPAHVNDGKLVYFNGLMPGFQEPEFALKLEFPDLRYLEVLQRTQNLPGSIGHFFPDPRGPQSWPGHRTAAEESSARRRELLSTGHEEASFSPEPHAGVLRRKRGLSRFGHA